MYDLLTSLLGLKPTQIKGIRVEYTFGLEKMT